MPSRFLPSRALSSALAVAIIAASALTSAALPVSVAEAATTAAGTDYTALVDPFVSTAGDDGNDIPGAQAPHGLAKVNPLTTPNRSHSGYDYNEDQIAGFTQTGVDGTGGSGAGGDILVVPTTVQYTARPSTGSYAHTYSHDDEEASPGYYRVGLAEGTGTDGAVTQTGKTINAEVAATTRTSLQRFGFSGAAPAAVVVDLANNFTSRVDSDLTVTTEADGTTALSGMVSGTFGTTYTMYFYATTTQKVSGLKTWGAAGTLGDETTQSGVDTGAILTFDPSVEEVELRVTLSTISVEQAAIDQENEVGSLTFDQAREQTKAEWNKALGAVDVTASVTSDPDGSLTRLFYTHLYRMYAVPMNATSTSGTYMGVDGAVHKADGFTYYDSWSSWDDFRKYSVLAYIDPEGYRDIVQSLITLFADANATGKTVDQLPGSIPTVRWELSSVIVADALSKGFTGFDRLDEGYAGLEAYAGYSTGDELRQGYVSDDPGESVLRGYEHWALAQIATALGKTDEAASHTSQSLLPIENLYKDGAWTAADGTSVALLTPRDGSGNWGTVDYEKFEAANLYQGTLWQYNWYDAYDMEGLIEAMGGTDAATQAIEHMFGEDSTADDGSTMLHSNANEIDLQAPYLFNYVGEASLTQKWVRQIYTGETWNRYIATGSTNEASSGNGEFTPPIKTKVYKLDPEGFLPTMDNDAGTMSTMFVAAAIGLFPVTAGSSEYQIGSPFFDKTTITYANGASFSVTADGVSSDSYYVQSASLNGSDFGNTWVDYSTLIAGGDLSFTMGSQPSDWGSDTAAAYSLSASTDDGGSGGDDGSDGGAASTAVTVSASSIAAADDNTVDGSVTMTLPAGVTFTAAQGTDLAATGGVTISGLPGTVSARVTVASEDSVTIALQGSVTGSTPFTLVFADAALSGARGTQLTGTGVSTLSPLSVSVAASERIQLRALVDEAELVRQGNYAEASYSAFAAARERAETRLAQEDATAAQLRVAEEQLQNAISALTLSAGAFSKIEAEDYTDWAGGGMKKEAYHSAGDIGGVTEGSWLSYSDLDFGGVAPQSISILYANEQSVGSENSTVDVHAGGTDGPIVATVSLKGTGSWANYSTASANLTDAQALIDAKQVTLVFHKPSGQSWVANVDALQFSSEPIDDSAAPTAVASLTATNVTSTGGGTKTLNLSGGLFENVTDGAWAQWETVDFGDGADEITVTYDKPQSRAASDSAIEVRLGSADGDPLVTVPLAYTGSGWGTTGSASASVDPAVFAGSQDVYLAFVSTTQSDSQPYVANISSIDFTRSAATGVVLEAEDYVDKSDTGFNTGSVAWDDGTTPVNLGGTANGSWLDYGQIDFGTDPKNTVSVHYVNNSSRSGTGSAIQLYLDDFDAQNPGTPFATIALPVTGSSWTAAGTVKVQLPEGISGSHQVYLRLTSNTDGSHPYVANLDNLTFTSEEAASDEQVDKTALQAAIDAYQALEGDAQRYGSIDFGTFTTQLAAARTMRDSDAATREQVIEQTRALTLAAGQLVPKVRIQLENLAEKAGALDDERYTDDSWQSLAGALEAAQSTIDDESASDARLQEALTALQQAVDALAIAEPTVPAAPAFVSATPDGSAVEVAWSIPDDDGGSAITGYLVELDDGHSVEIDDPTQQSATFTWLDNGSYRARVSAINAIGTGAASAYTQAATTASTVPGAPVVTGVVTQGDEVIVAWQAPEDNGGTAITAYRVTLDDGTSATVSADTLSALLISASGADAHTATVEAFNAAGSSADATADTEDSDGTDAATASYTMDGTGFTATAAFAASTLRAVDSGESDYTSSPFTAAQLNASYSSDSWNEENGDSYFVNLLNGFTDLSTDTLAENTTLTSDEKISAENDTIAVSINNGASQDQVDRAEVDADNSPTQTMSDSLGSQLGPIYLAALQAGELPKTAALFDKVSSSLNETETAKSTFNYLRPYVRLGFVGDGGLIYESDNGSYDGLTTSGSFPSGHTYSGYQAGTILATLLPEMSAPILARTSEYGDNRIVLGFHYPLDVIGSRMTSQATVAHRWADDDFAVLLQAAHEEIENVLLAKCEAAGYGDTLTACAGDAYDGMTEAEDISTYTERLSYGFTRVSAEGQQIEVPEEAAALLTTAFPDLNDEQRTEILEQTAIDSGYPLDQTADGEASWQRINLAAAMNAEIVVNEDGSVTVTNHADETAASVSTASAIQVAGTDIDGFDQETRTYVVDWPADQDLPEVTATASEDGATVDGTTSGALVQRLFARVATPAAPEQTITVTSGNGEFTTSYRVVFALTEDDHTPGTDPGDGGSTDPGDGGSTDPGDGGSTDPGDGGSTDPGDGGSTDPGDGGSTDPGDGGSTDPGDGGSTDPGDGGSTDPGDGGSTDPGDGSGGSDSGSGTASDGGSGNGSGTTTASGSSLPATGGDITATITLSVIAVILLAGGAVVLLIARRRRMHH